MGLSVASVKKGIGKLCRPAQVYLVFSVVSMVMYLVTMLERRDLMATGLGITVQGLALLLWTCVLNWICKMKYGTGIAWFLVLLPLILLFILLIIFYELALLEIETTEDTKDIIEDNCSQCN